MNKKEIYQKAIDSYGFDSQLNQLTEECGELITACNKLRRQGHKAVPLMVDEISDVMIMCEQIIYAMGFENQVELRTEFKLKRLEDRINNKTNQL